MAKPHLIQANTKTNGAVPFNNDVVAGDLLVASSHYEAGAASPTIDDTFHSSWTKRGQVDGSFGHLVMWTAVAPSAGANTITVTSAGASYWITHIAEFSPVGAYDTAASGTFSGTPATITTGNITTAENSELLIACLGGYRNAGLIGSNDADAVVYAFQNGADSLASMFKVSGANGTYNASFTNASNDIGGYVAIAFKPSGLAVDTISIINAKVGVPYSQTLAAVGGVGTYTWSFISGSLPIGMQLTELGVICGTPTGIGTYSFTVKVSDGTNTATKAFTISIGTAQSTAAVVQSASIWNAPSQAFGSSVVAGNLGMVLVPFYSIAGLPSIMHIPYDTRGTAYRLVGTRPHEFMSLAVYLGTFPASGSNTVTALPSGYVIPGMAIAEISGVQALEEGLGWADGSTASGTITSGTLVTKSPNELVLGLLSGWSSSMTETEQAPYTLVTKSGWLAVEKDTKSASGSYTAQFAIADNTNGSWVFGLLGLIPSVTPILPHTAKRRTVIMQ